MKIYGCNKIIDSCLRRNDRQENRRNDDKSSAFSLVELIVGITISMILMIGIGVFVGGGISNMTLQEKILDNNEAFGNFSYELQNTFSRIDIAYTGAIKTNSGVILKQNKEFDKGGFVYIGTETLSGAYCSSDSEAINTKHIFIKNFIPFEEEDEDLFTDFSQILTSKSVNLYHTDQKLHALVRDSDGVIVVGKGVFGDKFIEGGNGTDIYLNNPTGLTNSGSILFISDTLNNRVLAYDTNSTRIYKFLDEKDGLDEPTGLYYDSGEKALYIANSGAGEILKYSSKSESSNLTLNLSFSGITASVTNFKVEFFNNSGNQTITGPASTGSFTFTNFLLPLSTDYLTGSINSLRYYFANYSSSTSDGPRNLGTCTPGVSYYLNGTGNPEKQEITCVDSSTGTVITSNGNITQNLNSGTTYDINISNIIPNFTGTGTYYTKLSLYNGSALQHEQYFPYFVQGDDNLLTLGDNTLEVAASGLSYPTGVWNSSGIKYREFFKNLDGINRIFSDLSFDSQNDYKLETPVLNLDFDYSGQLLNLYLNYYKQFNCYNTDKKIERNFILKKSYK